MTKSLFLIQSQPYYIYTNFSPKTNSQLKNPHPQKFSHQKTRNHKKISPQIITTLLYIQIFLIKPTQLKNFYIMDFSLSAKAQNDKNKPKASLLVIPTCPCHTCLPCHTERSEVSIKFKVRVCAFIKRILNSMDFSLSAKAQNDKFPKNFVKNKNPARQKNYTLLYIQIFLQNKLTA